MKLRFLFEAGFNLLLLHLNFGFYLRAAYIRENTVFLNVFPGYITERCFFFDKSWYRRTVFRAQIIFSKSLYRSNPKKTSAVQSQICHYELISNNH